MLKSKPRWAFLSLALIPLLVLFYQKSVAVRPSEHFAFIDSLNRLKAWEGGLSRDLMKTTYGLLSHVGPASQSNKVPEHLLARLETVPDFIDPKGITAIQSDLRTYRRILEKKVELLEKYKTRYAILRNSLRYFPVLSNDLALELENRPKRDRRASLIKDLQNKVLLYHMASAQEVVHSQSILSVNKMRTEMEAQIKTLEALINQTPDDPTNPDFLIIINHIKNILERKQEIDNVLHVYNIALQPQSSQIYGSINATYNHYYELAQTRANYYRLWLFSCSVVLVGAIILAFIRLAVISGNLKTANDRLEDYSKNLERMVQSRTLELKDKNETLETTLEKLQTMRDQMVIQEKMASLGALTAGIAHEIQDPLNDLAGRAHLAKESARHLTTEMKARRKLATRKGQQELVRQTEDLSDMIEHILDHEKRLQKILRGMMMHSQNNQSEQGQTDLNTLIEEFLRLTYYGMKAKDPAFAVIVEKDLDPEVGSLQLQPQDMGQVLINLFNNAFYALQQQKTNLGDAFEPRLEVTTKNSPNRVITRIRDNGPGIPEEIRRKIFKPFFTTKPLGEGTGLGLSISWEIITEEHQGELKVTSEEGRFTEFTIVLPKKIKSATVTEKTPA
ncbi:Histidine kinase domain-containing protein [Sulfidibacter corallicola]|uniref:histidine kinase n=1 Tax=Sulfidibacter corallicola TaxID=2818388 RepID=A0A8A4TFB7_SULCO|nr:DAHL domain-containing protein [Sulfidibacter corallicola]QTD48240.1 hypothetical protein J3U87_21870 [Sulfidibacter corallicola]